MAAGGDGSSASDKIEDTYVTIDNRIPQYFLSVWPWLWGLWGTAAAAVKDRSFSGAAGVARKFRHFPVNNQGMPIYGITPPHNTHITVYHCYYEYIVILYYCLYY